MTRNDGLLGPLVFYCQVAVFLLLYTVLHPSPLITGSLAVAVPGTKLAAICCGILIGWDYIQHKLARYKLLQGMFVYVLE